VGKDKRRKEVKNMSVEKTIAGASLAEVLDRVLDKGLVIDAWVRASLVGIEFLGIEARIVVASVETYLKYAEAIGLTAGAAA
jgi:hypothetical protein